MENFRDRLLGLAIYSLKVRSPQAGDKMSLQSCMEK